jgi:hypothetical protein
MSEKIKPDIKNRFVSIMAGGRGSKQLTFGLS